MKSEVYASLTAYEKAVMCKALKIIQPGKYGFLNVGSLAFVEDEFGLVEIVKQLCHWRRKRGEQGQDSLQVGA